MIHALGTGQLNRDRRISVFFMSMEWTFQKPSHTPTLADQCQFHHTGCLVITT